MKARRLPRVFWLLPIVLVLFAGFRLDHPAAAKCSAVNCNGSSCVDDCDKWSNDPSFALVPWSTLNNIAYCVDYDADGIWHCAGNTAQTFKVYDRPDYNWIATCQRVTGGCRAGTATSSICTPAH